MVRNLARTDACGFYESTGFSKENTGYKKKNKYPLTGLCRFRGKFQLAKKSAWISSLDIFTHH